MKITFIITALLFAVCGYGQLSVNILVPPAGIMDKQQLWNILVTNTELSSISVQVQASFSEAGSGQPVFTATTSPLDIVTGTRQLSATTIGPIQYNIINGNYRMDPGPTGLLPIGTFNVCYDFVILKFNKVVQECQQLNIPPLGPLLLNQPANGSVLQEWHPSFSWLPPSPVTSLGNLRYEFRLVEMLPNQSPADAIQDNIPFFTTQNLASANYQYSPNAPALASDREYAWQIRAVNNLTEIAKSETWSFSTVEKDATIFAKASPVYIKLKKAGGQEGYAVFWGNLQFDYENETGDRIWNIAIQDLSTAPPVSFTLNLDSVKLARGQNLVSYDAGSDTRWIDRHQYLLRVMNSRNETWQIRFEYRKPD